MKVIIVIGENDCDAMSTCDFDHRHKFRLNYAKRVVDLVKASPKENWIIVTSGSNIYFQPGKEEAVESSKWISDFLQDVRAKYFTIRNNCLQTVIGTALRIADDFHFMESKSIDGMMGGQPSNGLYSYEETSNTEKVEEIIFVASKETSKEVLEKFNSIKSDSPSFGSAQISFQIIYVNL